MKSSFRAAPKPAPAVLLLGLALLAGCQRQGSDQASGFYSYVDAQGNLVTVENRSPVGNAASTAAGDAPMVDEQDGDSGIDGPSASLDAALGYKSSQVLDAELAQRDEQRFVTFPGYDGQLVTEELEKSRMQAASEERYPGYDEIDYTGAFIETSLSIAADCCLDGLAAARLIAAGQEMPVRFKQTVEMANTRPAGFLKLADDVAVIRIASFVRKGLYQYPQLVFLSEAGVPLLHVSNIFQRNYTETWYRFAYYAGDTDIPEGAAFVALYLDYAAGNAEDGWQLQRPPTLPGEEKAASLYGEVVVRALAADSGN